ncbi:putative leucine-rich repeat-containing protein DDB_G0290503 [Pelobates fuscus]|uniref:putative leucine-rich repeat-containing protein DDB_G0290503 n=1 Tax=Pelobates fuscus TaxID=191477 RepID=UPI002FE48290
MALRFGGSNPRTFKLFLHILLIIIFIISFKVLYIDKYSELEEKQALLHKEIMCLAVDRSNLKQRTAILQEQLENQTKELDKLQNIHHFQAEQQMVNFLSEKNSLQDAVLSKENAIKDLKEQYEILLQQAEKKQFRLLEQLHTQSTECINIISMMRDYCNETRGNKSQIVDKSNEEETGITGITEGFPFLPVANQTQNKLYRSNLTYPKTNNRSISLNAAQHKWVDNVTDSGGNKYASKIAHRVENKHSTFKKEFSSFVRDNENTMQLGNTIKELREESAKKQNLTDALNQEKTGEQSEKDILKEEIKKVEDNIHMDNEWKQKGYRVKDLTQITEEEKTNKTQKTHDLDNNVFVGEQEENKVPERLLWSEDDKTQKTESHDFLNTDNNNRRTNILEDQTLEDTVTERKKMTEKKKTMKKENKEIPEDKNNNEWVENKHVNATYNQKEPEIGNSKQNLTRRISRQNVTKKVKNYKNEVSPSFPTQVDRQSCIAQQVFV